MIRAYSYKAWLADGEQARALAVMRELREIYLASALAPDAGLAWARARERLQAPRAVSAPYAWGVVSHLHQQIRTRYFRGRKPNPGRTVEGGMIPFGMGAQAPVGEGSRGLRRSRAARFEPQAGRDWLASLPLTRRGADRIDLRFRMHREIPAEGVVKGVQLTAGPGKGGDFTWRLVFLVDLPDVVPRDGVTAGVDIGWRRCDGTVRVMALAVDGRPAGFYYAPHGLLERGLDLLSTPGAPASEWVRFRRHRVDAYRKLVARLFDEHPQIGELRVERLSLKRMRSIEESRRIRQAMAPGLLLAELARAAQARGVRVIPVLPMGTSRIHHACGARLPRRSQQAIWVCPKCRAEFDQDMNAALNIAEAPPARRRGKR